jgi:molybdopterin converting factor subunit 1
MSDLEISLTDDATVSDAARELIRLHPAISGDSSRLMIAVNEEYQEHDYPLNENDEVAFIPPVSGG